MTNTNIRTVGNRTVVSALKPKPEYRFRVVWERPESAAGPFTWLSKASTEDQARIAFKRWANSAFKCGFAGVQVRDCLPLKKAA